MINSIIFIAYVIIIINVGERAHKAIKDIEVNVIGLRKRKKNELAIKFQQKIDEMWAPLR